MPYVGRDAASFTTVVDVTVSDDLTVTDDASIGGNLTIDGTLSTATGIVHLGDSNTSLDFGADTQTFFSGAVKNLNLTTGGAVFNEDSADIDFRVESNGNANMLFVDGGNDAVGIGNNNPADYGALIDNLVVGTTSGNNGITIASGTDSGGRLCFADNTSSPQRGMIEYSHANDSMLLNANGATRMTITSGGDIDVETGDIFFSTAGKGIVLGVTSNTAANTLDDYEEGTWTPSLGGDTTYNARSGTYTKIGNKVTVWANVAINNLGSGSARDLSGLPFAASNIATFNVNGNGVSYYTNLATSVSGLFAIPSKNATTILFTRIPAGGNITMSHNNFDVYKGSTDTYFNFTYTTA